ncbi:xanthine dehydrogenase family protein molybdopterin-binding subunit [Streptomyces silvisoli]|uniref:Xanthine dehydrogenase family protein molybdopterin-binding subunit n=1 Tax=Streptomyces silvisoli TaxID=3034235 RepID=A0ABT5ZE88_9ACTN|nr:xanthine dehydrogenase family protein molybdopterin-binding subunit [Streptomyces silvisoli]MDF3287996.1 xanthine dehydrogenase family protein molybdopterin-binding subunit [Streptomyces silvisoli]
MTTTQPLLGAPTARLEAREKVTGAARYATDHPTDRTAYAWPVPATVVRGEITSIDTTAALADPAVLAVLTHQNAPRLHETDDPNLAVLQSPHVAHRGQFVALAVATSLEAARSAAEAIRVTYRTEPHDVVLTPDHPGLYKPDEVNAGLPADREHGDFDTAYANAPVRIDAVYETPALHNHPLEPHAATALWDGDDLTVYDSNQHSSGVQRTLAQLFGLANGKVHVVNEHVGGGFGAKGTARPPVVLAAMAARTVRRPVKLALPRNQLAAVTGYRAPTIQRIRIGADPEGHIEALAHEAITQSSTITEFVEQAATPSRTMYNAPHSRTTHRVARLDVPTPSWMRAPGECPGMFALESAMDELALACGVDPIELRTRNEPAVEPDSGLPFSSRHLVECLREGARRFGWHDRDARIGGRREGRLLIGSGVAASTFPALVMPSQAEAHAAADGSYEVRVSASDIGTGARTVLTQIAADTLGVPLDSVRVRVGSSDLPPASVAGGSSGTASWGWPVHKACTELRQRLAERGYAVPEQGITVATDIAQDIDEREDLARHAFGAQFAEVQVDPATGETRVRRLLGVFAAGRILNSRTARSQFIGGMTMGLGMALLEGSTMDPAFGDYAERDLAAYHVAACADVPEIDVHWIEEEDPHLNPMGSKGIGEIGIVGTAAAIANAVHHATGVRVRALPIHPDVLVARLTDQPGPP